MHSHILKLSHNLNSKTPTYGNRDSFSIIPLSSISSGDTANSSKLILSTNHLGSHVDVPKHFFDDGKSIDKYPADYWFCDTIQLIDVPCNNARLINSEDIKAMLNPNIEVLLLRTGYENYRDTDKYWNDNPGLSSELGSFIKNNCPNIRFIGFDFISLTSWKFRDEGKAAHRTFLNSDKKHSEICVLEDLSLKEVSSTITKIVISPLVIDGSCSAPVTIFAFES